VIFLLAALLISSLSATLREARRRAEAGRQRLQFLVAASQRLADSLDYDKTLAAVARLVVPRLADYCLIDVVEEDGSIRRVTVAHADRDQDELVRQLLIPVRSGLPPTPSGCRRGRLIPAAPNLRSPASDGSPTAG
jgi:K+-sensing histidine kinase KdpD